MVEYYNPNSVDRDPIAVIVLKIFLAAVVAIEIVFVLKPILQFAYGVVSCTGCSSITAVFVTTVVPIAVVFISVYSLITVFLSKIQGR